LEDDAAIDVRAHRMRSWIDGLLDVQNGRWQHAFIEPNCERFALPRALGALDLEAVGGIRWLGESSDNAVVLGLAVPLPVFDRNQGSSREAEYRAPGRGGVPALPQRRRSHRTRAFAAASEGLSPKVQFPDAEAALAADEATKGLSA
jgi:hypothetical protein